MIEIFVDAPIELQVLIDIHEIANESIRKMKLEYPDYDIVIVDDHPIGQGHFN